MSNTAIPRRVCNLCGTSLGKPVSHFVSMQKYKHNEWYEKIFLRYCWNSSSKFKYIYLLWSHEPEVILYINRQYIISAVCHCFVVIVLCILFVIYIIQVKICHSEQNLCRFALSVFAQAFSMWPPLICIYLDTLRPAKQIQMCIQKSAETSSYSWGEARYPSKLRVVTDSILARWEQGGRVTQPFPFSCIEVKTTKIF